MVRFALFFFSSCLALQAQYGPISIVDVTVVPMDRELLLEHQTVLVRDGRIAAMGSLKSVRLPSASERIDGRGKFLMPGLADMHVHFVREALPETLPTYILKPGERNPGIPASASANHEIENEAYA